MTEQQKISDTKKTIDDKDLTQWQKHLQDEVDASFYYRLLSQLEKTLERREIFVQLAAVEDRHADIFEKMIVDHTGSCRKPAPSVNAKFYAWIARKFGTSYLISMLLREEGVEVKGYLTLFKNNPAGSFKDATYTIAKEEMEHAETLQRLTGDDSEPWHQTKSGGFLRNVVYGFNDGLTANFGLFAGVIGAAVQPHIVLLSGFAGMLSDALSMGSSGYLAAKSELEVYDHEIAMEKEEILLMPEVEQQELQLIYEAKGIERERAKLMAKEVMSDPERALGEKVREELGIGTAHSTPMKEGLVTGAATAVGAFIPLAPFLLFSGTTGIWISFILSMLSHFGVGAARSIFTGRGIFRSGIDMFLVGLGIAVVGYYAGEFLVILLH
ncbi:MAG: VIT1/CCC1 transporter family protein [Bacteroidota bacterium]